MQQLTTERLNRLLYNSKDRVYSLLRIVTYINSTVAACLLVYGYGFNLSVTETTRVFHYHRPDLCGIYCHLPDQAALLFSAEGFYQKNQYRSFNHGFAGCQWYYQLCIRF
jgi:hypothetical protein